MEKREMSPLKKARFERRLTQAGLMLKTSITQTKLSLIENNYYLPAPDEARKIAKALGMKVGELFPEKGVKR